MCRLWLHRYSKDKPRLGDTLDIIKFICKDFWQAVLKKQIDNLKTNHRVSRWLQHTPVTQQAALSEAACFVCSSSPHYKQHS